MNTVTNTTFTILRADENGDMNVIGTEVKRSTKLPFSFKVWFEGMVGQDVKMTRWTEGETEATVIGRGGKLNHRA